MKSVSANKVVTFSRNSVATQSVTVSLAVQVQNRPIINDSRWGTEQADGAGVTEVHWRTPS